MKSSTVIGGVSEKYERHGSDLYSTPKECTFSLIDFLNSDVETFIPFNWKIWEPACGDYYIVAALREKGYNNLVATDIVSGDDFLTTSKRANIIITNPPFNKLAEAFIKRAIELDLQMFAFLLKGQYWHSKTRLNLLNSYKPSYVLPLTWRPVFVKERGDSPTMEFSWNVWFKGDRITKYIPIKKPEINKKNQLF